MKKKFVYLMASIALATIVGIAGFKYAQKRDEAETQFMTASWAYSYANMEEISQDSDIIALVRVNGGKDSYEISGIPFVEFHVEVITPIYGADLGDRLSIFMADGVADDPLLKEEEELLIFARQNENGTVSILGGPQGRFVYDNGKLNAMAPVNTDAGSANAYANIQVTNADLKDIIGEIETALDSKE